MEQQRKPEAIKSETPTEIRIAFIGGNRRAFYRQLGTVSRFWHSMPVRQAEKAIREGRVHIGLFDTPAVAYVALKVAA